MSRVALVLEVLGAILLAWVMWMYRRRVRRESVLSLAYNIQVCRNLLALLQAMLRHRMAAAACLAGETLGCRSLSEQNCEIEASFTRLREIARRESGFGYVCFDLHAVSLLQYRWRELLESMQEAPAAEGLLGYAYPLEQILRWLGSMGERKLEPRFAGALWVGLVRNYVFRLPQLADCLGQAAALATSVRGQGACTPMARVRLMYLAARVESLLKQARDLDQAEPGVAETARQAVQGLVRLIRTRMLLGSDIQVEAEDFRRHSQAALDGVFAWIESSGMQLLSQGVPDTTASSGDLFSR